MRAQYSDVFTGLGKYEKEYHIEVDSNVTPVIQRCRKVPYARYDKLKHTLVDLEKRGVIASVDRPTEWVHNLVITEKRDGRMRVCLDPKPLNVAIKRERYEIPTPADVQSRLSGMRVFTVFDMQDAYWHVKLSPESSYLCTFHTPWGRKRFLRMPFGISSASEVMQKRNEEAFGDIQGVHVIADDLIISAKDETEHDAIVSKVFERARQQNVKFNANKIQYKVNTVTYMGHIVSADGMRPDPRKVEAIVNMPRPSDRQGLLRLLGMIKYLAQYIPNESSITAPLRSLLKQDVEWSWQPEHDVAMQLVRETLAQDTVLTFYDVRKPATIQADASQSGLGCGLMQQGRPVAFASRALTEAEHNYSQIEKEMLAICFACQKFHQYIYGKSIDVHSDHRPLESILKKPIGKASPRLQRMMLQLQRYTLNVRYVPGKLMYVADTLSRAYITGDAGCGAPEDMEVLVHSLVENLPATIDKLEQFRRAFAKDQVMQTLKQSIRHGWPQRKSAASPEIQAYWDIRDELHEAEGLLLFGERLVVPASLRPDMLQVIHEGHLGRDKCKARARVSLYWPLMGVDIEEVVGRCAVCQKYRAANQKEPHIPHSVPALRWQQVALDIMTHRGKDYLVAVDYLSKFPEIALLERKTAACVILHLKSMFARHGIADHLMSDNMPFASCEFQAFAKEWRVKLTTSSPTYAQSNGQIERFVSVVKQMLRKADEEGRDPYLALLAYRNTAVTGMSYSPAQMLMSRVLNSKIPILPALLEPKVVDPRPQLEQRQRRHKAVFDRGARELPKLQAGEKVRMRRNHVWMPATVVREDGHPRSYIVKRSGTDYRRNRRDLLQTAEVVPLDDDPIDDPIVDAPPAPQVGVVPVAPPVVPREAAAAPLPVVNRMVEPRSPRPRRVIVRPAKYNDYVCE